MKSANRIEKKVDIAEKMQDEASEWAIREDASYRKFKTTELQWESYIVKNAHQTQFEIANSWVAAAPNGGGLAATARKGLFISGDYLLRDNIVIFGGNGKMITCIPVLADCEKVEAKK